MAVERADGPKRVGHQVLVMDLENRRREGRVVGRGDHQLSRREPTVAVLASDLELVDMAGERPPEDLGQPRDRGQNGKRIAVHEHDACIRIDGAKRGERENVVGAFEHPLPAIRVLVPEVLQQALVKPVGVEVPGLVEPAAIARNMVGRIKAQAGKDMRCDL
jgi:hypothetical protein